MYFTRVASFVCNFDILDPLFNPSFPVVFACLSQNFVPGSTVIFGNFPSSCEVSHSLLVEVLSFSRDGESVVLQFLFRGDYLSDCVSDAGGHVTIVSVKICCRVDITHILHDSFDRRSVSLLSNSCQLSRANCLRPLFRRLGVGWLRLS